MNQDVKSQESGLTDFKYLSNSNIEAASRFSLYLKHSMKLFITNIIYIKNSFLTYNPNSIWSSWSLWFKTGLSFTVWFNIYLCYLTAINFQVKFPSRIWLIVFGRIGIASFIYTLFSSRYIITKSSGGLKF